MSELVIDHLWQSSLFAGLLGLLTLIFRGNRASVRFGLWLASSLKFLLPFSLLIEVGRHLQWEPAQPLPMDGPWSTMMDQIAEPATYIQAANALPVQPEAAIPMIAAPASPPPPQFDLVVLLMAVWAIGFLALLVLWAVRWFKLRSILKSSTLAPIGAPIPVMSTPAVVEPALFGVFNPVLLWPEGISPHLSDDQVEAILAHEICHWRRRDNVWAMIHMLVEAVFWFHPLVWWLGQRLVVEREKACDEAVIAAGEARESYAEGILKVCQFCVEQKLFCVPAVSGGNLKKRIEAIMTFTMPAKLHGAKKLLLVSAAIAALAGPVLVGCTVAPGTPEAPVTKPGEDPNIPYQRMIEQRRYEQSKARTEVQIDAKQLDSYVGYYRLWNRIYTVIRNSDHLFVQLSGEVNQMAPDEIFPSGEKEFFLKSRPAQVSFTLDEKGLAERMITHEGGYDQIFRHVSEAEGKGIREYLDRKIKENKPTPGMEALLRRHYEAIANGAPDYEDLADNTTKNTREEQGMISRGAGTYGAFQSIAFLGVDSNGWDMYRITFAAREFENSIVFRSDGKIDGIRPIPDRSILHKEVPIASRLLDAYVGYYQQTNTLIMTVTRDGNRLFLKGTNQAPFEIFAENDHDFFTKTNPMRFIFQGDGVSKATGLIMHTSNRDYPAVRISDQEAQAAEAFLEQRIKQNTALNGTEAALRKFIMDMQKGQPAYETMDSVLAGILRNTWPGTKRVADEMGELQTLTFKGVSQTGADIYAAHFVNGTQEYQIIVKDGIIRLLNSRLIS